MADAVRQCKVLLTSQSDGERRFVIILHRHMASELTHQTVVVHISLVPRPCPAFRRLQYVN